MSKLLRFLLLILLLTTLTTYSQNTARFLGTVIDDATDKSVQGATVVLYSTKDSSVVRGGYTDKDGNFKYDKIVYGDYYLKISFVGYQIAKFENLRTTKANAEINLGTIRLKQSASEADVVEIVAEKQAIEYSMGKKVFNVDKSGVNTGGNVLDVLRAVPAVDVDQDNNVSLRGNSNVNIMIDGKPLAAMGGSTNLLQQIPAANVESIEVVTNPSAKYDAEGQTGILNIITKKQIQGGFNGMLFLNTGTYDNYSSSANFNYRTDFFNIFTNLDYSFSNRRRRIEILRKTNFLDSSANISESDVAKNGYRYSDGNGGGAKLGMELTFSRNTNLTLSGGIRKYEDNDIEQSRNIQSLYANNTNNISQIFDFVTHEKNPFTNYDGSINFMHKFNRKGHELTFDGFYNTNNITRENNQDNLYYNLSNGIPIDLNLDRTYQVKNGTSGDNKNLILQTDYVRPFETDRLELGLKYTLRDIAAVSEFFTKPKDSDFIKDTIASNQGKFKENVIAAYFIYGSKLSNNIDLQGGLRTEYTIQGVRDVTGGYSNFERNYIDFFPNLTFSYKLDDFQSFQLSYSRRINRPRLNDLNPFIDKSDPLFWRTGNTTLMPEYINSYQIGMLNIFKQFTVNSEFFVRDIRDVINQRFREKYSDSTNILIDKPLNMAQGLSYGMDLSVSYELTKTWRMNTDFSFFDQYAEGTYKGVTYSNKGFAWSAKYMTSAVLFEDISMQIMANYSSPVVTAQGKRAAFYMADISFKKDFMEKKLTVSLRWMDIFRTMRFGGISQGDNFYSSAFFTRDFTSITLGISYRINDIIKQDRKRRREDGGSGGGDDY